MAKSKLFFGGIPTTPEVAELMAQVRAEPGMRVSYEDIEAIIGVKAGTTRFRTTTNAYRRKLYREKGIQTKAEGGAIHFLTADAAQDEAGSRIIRVGRSAGRLVRDIGTIKPDELTTEERRTKHRLMLRESAAVLESVRASARRLAEPAPKSGGVLRLAK